MSKHKCDNCARILKLNELNEAKDLEERLDEDSEHMPSGECPGCGALCYPLPEPLFPRAVTGLSHLGFVLDIEFLKAIKKSMQVDCPCEIPALEQIEEVLLTAEKLLKDKNNE